MENRISELERRVAALEALVAGPTPDVAPAGDAAPGTDAPPGTFWALDGLRPHATGSGAVVYAGTVRTGAGEVEWQFGHAVDDLLGAPEQVGPDEPGLSVVAARLAALGHPARLAILAAVLRGHDRTSDLADLLDLGTTGQVYHHVKALTAAGWLRTVARGRVAVPAERVVPLLVAMGASS